MNEELEKKFQEAEERINERVDFNASVANCYFKKEIKMLEIKNRKAINQIFFKAVLAEQVGWNGFEMMGSGGRVLMAEIL